MKQLLSQLTIHDYGLPSYSLITSVHYEAYCDKGDTLYIDRNDRRNLKIVITGDSGVLTVLLRPLRRPLEVRTEPLGVQQNHTMSFTKDDILNFVESVHDVNRIHRESPYVVPGLLILESLWYRLQQSKALTALTVSFQGPTLAGDHVELVECQDGTILEGRVGAVVLFTAHLHDLHT